MSGFRFSDAVSAVQAALHPTGSSRRSGDHAAQPGSPTDTREFTLNDDHGTQQGASDAFPQIDDARLYALIPSFGLNAADDKRADASRSAVRAALDEMKLNYDLDPKSLGERSEYNRGCYEIVKILTRLRLQAPQDATGAALRSGLSGEVPADANAAKADLKEGENKGKAGGASQLGRAYETHDLLKAIDRRDVETIMAIRDANFDLLLDLGGGGSSSSTNTKNSTPLGYAMGLGKEWEGICIVIVGALSRFVNQLPDPEEEDLSGHDAASGQNPAHRASLKRQLDPRTMTRLRKVKANLKLAIDSSLQLNQTSLLASYCQVLNMSEGDGFVHKSVYAVGHALRARIVGGGSSIGHDNVITSADPFAVARAAVMQYVGEALRSKRDRIAAVGDYVDNACGDLILMALWDAIRLEPAEKAAMTAAEQESLHPELLNPLPAYFFARDERVTSHFVERQAELRRALEILNGHDKAKLPKPQRRPAMLKRAQEIAEALGGSIRSLSSSERLERLRSVIMP